MDEPCECCGKPGQHMMEWDEWLCSECAAQAIEDGPPERDDGAEDLPGLPL